MAACITNHGVTITDRGGFTRVMDVQDVSAIQWSRRLNQKSAAEITLTGSACRQPYLDTVKSRRHEVQIWRNGEAVWVGPISTIQTVGDQLRIQATDVLDYVSDPGRLLSKAWPGPDAGGPDNMLTRAEQILRYELSTSYQMLTQDPVTGADTLVTVDAWENVNPPANVLPFLNVRPGALKTRASTAPFESSVLDHLLVLAKAGLAFTTVGRQVLIWDSRDSIGKLSQLTANELGGNVTVLEDGGGFASIIHVSASRPTNPSTTAPPAGVVEGVGNAGATHPYYGPWASLVTASSESGGADTTPTQSDLNGQAARKVSSDIPIKLTLPDGGLIDVPLERLVAGVQVPIRVSGLREVVQWMRLDSLNVIESSSQGESIKPVFLPANLALDPE